MWNGESVGLRSQRLWVRQFCQVELSPVAFVFAEAILRKLWAKPDIIVSRVTLAITLAAAIVRLWQSPSMMAVWGKGNGITGNPSVRTCSPGSMSVSMAARIALWQFLLMRESGTALPHDPTY